MVDSYEKRQRNRKKQQKREQKLAKKRQRRDEKLNAHMPNMAGLLLRFGDSEDDEPAGYEPFHTLRRADGATLHIDPNLWLCLLDLALGQGWRPTGTLAPDQELEAEQGVEQRWEPAAYFLARGQTIEGDDAKELGACALEGLRAVQSDEVPLRGGSFGPDNTLESVQLAMDGQRVPRENCESAYELLCGPPKEPAEALASFVNDGRAIRVWPEGYGAPA